MTVITDRDYQVYAVDSVFRYFEKFTGNPVVVMPTGTGKSIVIARFLQRVFKAWPNQKVMMVTHVKELIEQNYEKLLSAWPSAPAGINSAGLGKKDTHQRIIFGGIGTVANKAASFGHVDLLLVDECHLISPHEGTMYRKFINALMTRNPNLKVIGLSATPYRLGMGLITEEGGIFTDVCVDMTTVEAFNWFIDQGYLLPPIPKKTQLKVDLSGVHTRGGEFIESELQFAVDKDEITEKAIREAMEIGHNRQAWLVFTAGVEHACHVADMMNMMGIPTIAIHSKMTKSERDEGLRLFKKGHYRAATNNNVLTTGFDYPAIDLILMLRPTQSPVLWVQMLGRGTRPLFVDGFDLSSVEGRRSSITASPKQNCLVLDFAGNTKRLGPINDPVLPKKKGKGSGEAPVKECPVCATYNHAAARICISCGYNFPIETKLRSEASTEELVKIDLPIVEEFKVSHVTYAKHEKRDKPPMVRVTYYCGYRSFSEYVCFEHPDFAGRKATQWWRKRTQIDRPTTTEAALDIIEKVNVPTSIRVWINKQYPEIMDFCFDGSMFGKQEACPLDKPQVDVTGKIKQYKDVEDEDIPF